VKRVKREKVCGVVKSAGGYWAKIGEDGIIRRRAV
jgi:hypothetical protein